MLFKEFGLRQTIMVYNLNKAVICTRWDITQIIIMSAISFFFFVRVILFYDIGRQTSRWISWLVCLGHPLHQRSYIPGRIFFLRENIIQRLFQSWMRREGMSDCLSVLLNKNHPVPYPVLLFAATDRASVLLGPISGASKRQTIIADFDCAALREMVTRSPTPDS